MLASMQGVDERFQPAAGSLGLDGSHRPGAGGEVLLGSAAGFSAAARGP